VKIYIAANIQAEQIKSFINFNVMKPSVFILAQQYFSGLIKQAIQSEEHFRVVGCSDDYHNIWKQVQLYHPSTLIIEVCHPIFLIQNLVADLESSKYPINLLVFEKVDDKTIYYTTSQGKNNIQHSLLTDNFCLALQEDYQCIHVTYRDDKWNQRFGIGSDLFDRNECLIEVLRGTSSENFMKFQQLYNFDLKQKGYYLFIYELVSIENFDHNINRDCYNYIGVLLKQEFIELLRKYNGGEAFYTSPTTLYLYINDLDIVSVSRKNQQLSLLIKQLCYIGSRKTSFCFFSPRIEEIEDFRSFHELYQRNKTNHFFCYEKRPMTKAELSPPPYNVDYDTIQNNLDFIGDAISYDNDIERAVHFIRDLFILLVKPSYDIDLYYYCFNVIKRIIFTEYHPLELPLALKPVFGSDFMFNSIEESCEKIVSLLYTLSQAHINQSHLKYHYVHDTVNYIKEHYMSNLSLADISNAMQVNCAYLSQLFKRKTGVTIIQYLIEYRIRVAEKYLKDSDIPVSEIAVMVGFNDIKHFSKTFKKATGLSPLQYRKHTEPQIILV
jgi:two-component system response regulator YesN